MGVEPKSKMRLEDSAVIPVRDAYGFEVNKISRCLLTAVAEQLLRKPVEQSALNS